MTGTSKRFPIPGNWGWGHVFAVMALLMLAMRQSFVVRGAKGLTPMQVAVVCAVLFLGWQYVMHRRKVGSVPWGAVAVLGFWALSSLLSYAAVSARGVPLDQLTSTDQALLTTALSATTGLVLISVIRTVDDAVILLQGLVIGGTISALYALTQVATGIDLAVHMRIPVLLKADTATLVTDLMRGNAVRPQGAAGHPLELNAILTVLVPVAIGLALWVRHQGGRWWLWAAMGAVLGLGALSTVSRSSALGWAAAGAVMMFGWSLRRTMLVVAGLAVTALAALAVQIPMAVDMARVLTQGSGDNSLGSRAFGLAYVEQNFTRHLWLGQGVGTYDLSKQPVLDNEYLSRLMESGLLGVAALAATLMLGVWCGWNAAAIAKSDNHIALAHLCRAIAGAVAGIAVIAAILDIGGFRQISMTMVILVAAAVIMDRAIRTAERPERQPTEQQPAEQHLAVR